MKLKFYKCNQENLEAIYGDYVKKITENKDYSICTNVLCVVNYKKPKTSGKPDEYIKTDYKIMTSVLQINYCDGQNFVHKQPFIGFWFKNVSKENVIAFAKMEDINWETIIE